MTREHLYFTCHGDFLLGAAKTQKRKCAVGVRMNGGVRPLEPFIASLTYTQG